MRELAKFYLTFNGRIPRSQWWLGQIPLWAAGLTSIRYFSPDLSLPAPDGDIAVQTVIAWPTLALISKRFNDRGWPRRMLALPAAGLAVLLYGSYFGLLPRGGDVTNLHVHMTAILTNGLILLFVDNGFLRGQRGPNRYGPDPLSPPSQPSSS